MENITLTIDDMMCKNCKAKVEKALKELAGVSSFEVDLAAGKADVQYEASAVSPDTMKDAIEAKGLTVTSIA